MQNKWKHKDWETFPGTWCIVASISDEEMVALIKSDPQKYGNVEDWSKCLSA